MNKPNIYISSFPSRPNIVAVAIAEDGTFLGNHVCSNDGFINHDMGITSDWHHDQYTAHYPNGFNLLVVHSTSPQWIEAETLCTARRFWKNRR